MPYVSDRKPKYGYRPCLSCEKPIPLCIKRDVERKFYCSRECRLAGAMKKMQAARDVQCTERNAQIFRTCKTCGNEYPLTRDFFYSSKRKDGSITFASYCKVCHNEKVCQNTKNRWGDRKWMAIFRRYGITRAEYESMMTEQKGLCPICLKKAPTTVDHDHRTGKVRALLCNGCNAAIGVFQDNPEILQRAIQYLEDHHVSVCI